MEDVFLVGAVPKRSRISSRESQDSLDELARLVETAGGNVVGRTLQSLDSPSPATFIGKGKVDELRGQALRKQFKTLAFDEELKPAQQKNLAEKIPAKILDRTRLILDIFAKRARTREGILQVELAQLSYLLPRMTERYGRFEQQVGGIGTRGPGERKLEVEARHIRDRMAHLRRQTASIKLHRDVARERRHNVPLPTVAIVGYTNAGKSTLLNKLTALYGQASEPIHADDKLFATLDPTTRRVRLPSGRRCLFTDTVGFIEKLPHHLIVAFRSTLEETLDADVLLHLIDATDRNMEKHSQTVIDILNQLETHGNQYLEKIIPVYNKIDLLSSREKSRILERHPMVRRQGQSLAQANEPVSVSAVQGTGINRLLSHIEENLGNHMVETDLYIPFHQSRVLESLYRLGQVERVTHSLGGTRLHLKVEKSHWGKLQKILSNGA